MTVDPAAVPDLGTEPLPGVLLDWRWTDRDKGRWAALVRVRTPTLLQHERWIEGRHLRRQGDPPVVDSDGRNLI